MIHLITLMHFLQGAYYPRGGGQAISDRLAESIEGNGGEIVLKRRITEICVERGAARGVRTDRGEHIRSQIVISNADLKRTMLELVGADKLPPRFVHRIESFKMSLPLFVVYGATTLDLRSLGLGNFNVHLHGSIEGSGGIREADAGRLPQQASLFFSSASLKDPTNPRLAPAGETNFQAITIAPADYAAWRISGPEDHRSAEYKEVKQRFMDAIVEQLERRLIPGLSQHLTWLEGATPLTHERFVGATGGTSYGVENSVRQFGMFRQGHTTPIRNLFLCGASTVSGHGVIGAMTSGVGAAAAVLDDQLADRILLSSASAQPLSC
jgi:phytoene dehydrogenase-like protein